MTSGDHMALYQDLFFFLFYTNDCLSSPTPVALFAVDVKIWRKIIANLIFKACNIISIIFHTHPGGGGAVCYSIQINGSLLGSILGRLGAVMHSIMPKESL